MSATPPPPAKLFRDNPLPGLSITLSTNTIS